MVLTGTCQLGQQQLPITYDTCATTGGAQLVNNTLVGLGKARSTYMGAKCNYPSEWLASSCICTAQMQGDVFHICCPYALKSSCRLVSSDG